MKYRPSVVIRGLPQNLLPKNASPLRRAAKRLAISTVGLERINRKR